LGKNGEIERKFNCFNQDNRLVQNLVCSNHTTGGASSAIVKCCRNSNLCNQEENFLPPLYEARRILYQQLHTQSSSPSPPQASLLQSFGNHNNNYSYNNNGNNATVTSSLFEQYSNIPLEMRLVFIILSGLLLIFALALTQNLLIGNGDNPAIGSQAMKATIQRIHLVKLTPMWQYTIRTAWPVGSHLSIIRVIIKLAIYHIHTH